ncbi:MAG TPA: ABC transporter substrate-binding protein [Acidimicrobiales bacterium]|nr:ABC transporter substrate-binding protein [Acidimicrobiales bacterium]
MTFGMKLRLWARNAPRSNVLATSAVGVAVAVAVVAALLPGGGDDAGTALFTAPVAGGDTTAGPVGGSEGAVDGSEAGDAATSPASALTPSAGAAGGSTSGDPAPGGSGSSGASAPGGAGAAAGSGGSAASGAPVQLTASDQGVTEETIKVGFLIPSLAGLGNVGAAATDSRTDLEAVIKAYVDHVNETGGVAGRKVVYVTTESDPVNASSQQAACIRLATDEKVFAAFDTASTLGVSQNCYAQRGVILTTTASQTNSEQNFQRNGGMLASSGSSQNRVLLNWADLALAAGFIGPDKGKLGILSTECAPDPEAIDGDFKPYLKQKGIDYLDVRVSCDLAAAQQQVAGAVLQFRQAGVDRVLPSAIFVTVNNFLQAAESQRYRPTYYCSDMWGMCLDIFTSNFPAAQWDGAKGFTFSHSGADKAGAPLSPAVQRCSKILTDAGVPGVTEQMGKDAGAVAFCDSFFLWVSAMKHAPPNPRRADFPAALVAVGDTWESPYAGRAIFRSGKFNGGDDYSPVQWSGDCSCYTQTGPRAAAAH